MKVFFIAIVLGILVFHENAQELSSQKVFSDKTDLFNSQPGSPLAGIGVVIEKKEKRYVISEVIDQSPAESVGLRYKDVIRTVDRTVVDEITLRELVKRIRGKVGTTVTIGVEREDGRIQEFTVRRDHVRIPLGKKTSFGNGSTFLFYCM